MTNDEKQALKKKKPILRYMGLFLGLLVPIWFIIYLFPVSKTGKMDAFKAKRPLIIAHQGGEKLAPTSTLAAFRNAYDLGVDALEFDVHMTKDGHLVAVHDPTIDRTTNGSGTINEMTLEDIQSFDAGYSFQDLNGEYSYRGKGVYIPTVEEIFNTINDPNMLWIIEIKDTNNPKLYRPIAEKLWKIVQNFGIEDRVILASFDQAILDIVHDVTNGEAIVSGGRKEVTNFVIYHKLLLNGLYQPKADSFQIPIEEDNINLMDKKLIRGAHKRGMQIHYWTINDEKTMIDLIELGADGIITDRPDLLMKLLND